VSGLRIPAELVETVRHRALQYLEANRLSYSFFAERTGFSASSLKSFFAGEPGRLSPHIAQAIIEVAPEIGDGLTCPCCGRLMGGQQSGPRDPFVFTR